MYFRTTNILNFVLMRLKLLFGLFIASALFSCKTENNTVDARFEFDRLCGKWMDANKDNAFNEEWRRENENLIVGKGYVLSENDTVFIERLSIEIAENKVVYAAEVSNQNKDMKVPFTAVKQTNKKVVFENVQHDFPQRIIYHLTSDKELRVAIEGYENGVYRKLKFDFLRAD